MAINSPKLRGSVTVTERRTEPETKTPRAAPTKRIKVQDLSLEELYAQPKITPTVKKAILQKEDFSEIRPQYCDKVCTMPCSVKRPLLADVNTDAADVLIIQDHRAGADGWKTAQQVNQLHGQQIHSLARLAFGQGTTFKVLNLTKCWGETDKKVTATQMLQCAPYLWEEIRRTNPKAIVSMSTEVTKALGFKHSNYNNRGEFYMLNAEGLPEVPVVLTLHVRVLNMLRQNASGKMYGADFTGVILNDLAKIRMILDRQIQVGGLRDNIERIVADQVFVATTLADVREIVRTLLNLPPNQVISWDLETTGLDPWGEDARILTCQFGYRREDGKVQALVIPLWHRDQTFYDVDEAWSITREVIIADRPKVGHNVKFDVLYCTVTTGDRPRGKIFDTMLMIHSLNSGIQGNYGLKAAMWDHVPGLGLGGYDELLDETLDAEEIKRLVKLDKETVEEDDEETED